MCDDADVTRTGTQEQLEMFSRAQHVTIVYISCSRSDVPHSAAFIVMLDVPGRLLGQEMMAMLLERRLDCDGA